ncbi:MAG: hypothetical protein MRJ68_11325 [Nitrospira sp.]|nr:hypothetical protein [Nitrospira sp.]
MGSSGRLAELTSEAQERIQGDGHGVLPNLALAEGPVGELAKIDPEMASTARLVSEAKVLVKEVADSLRSYEERVDSNPGRLSIVEDRLAVLQKMKKKYGGNHRGRLEVIRSRKG